MWVNIASLTLPEATAYLARDRQPALWPVLNQVSGHIYATFGDWNRNGGTIPLLEVTLEPLSTQVVLETVYSEALERFYEFDGVIYAPYTDPRAQERTDLPGKQFFYARLEHGVWANAGAVDFDYTHVFGMVKYRHKVMAYGSRWISGILTDIDPVSSEPYLYINRPPGSSYLRIVDARVAPDEDAYPGVLYMRTTIQGPSDNRPVRFYRWDGESEVVEVSAEEAKLPDRPPLRTEAWRLNGGAFQGRRPAGRYAYLLLPGDRALTFDQTGVLALWQRKRLQ